MKIDNDRLRAFHRLAMDRNYHKAATNLCLSQSAVSQRIQKLEQEIGEKLVVRNHKGIRLTEAGQVLFLHACNLLTLEQETLSIIDGSPRGDCGSGNLRVASYSSVLRSVIIPALGEMIRALPGLHVEFFSRELKQLLPMLRSGQADMIILDHSLENPELQRHFLGEEELVHVRHRDHADPEQVFLDHDNEDMTTFHFFQRQHERNIEIRRCFYDDIYGIIDGVRLGLGQAIVSRHLIRGIEEIGIQPQPYPISNPVYLYHDRNRLLSRYQRQAVEALIENSGQYLSTDPAGA